MILKVYEGDLRMSEKKNGKRKISQKRKNKARWAWLEQVFFKIDEIKERLDKLEKSVKLINEKLNIVEQGESDE